MTIDIAPLRKEIGRKIADEDVVTEAPIKAMIATFDRPDKVPAPGEPIAPGWHLCFLHSYARPASLGKDGAAFEGGVLPKIPLARFGVPDDLVGVAILLASPAGRYITGAEIAIDGGDGSEAA